MRKKKTPYPGKPWPPVKTIQEKTKVPTAWVGKDRTGRIIKTFTGTFSEQEHEAEKWLETRQSFAAGSGSTIEPI